MAKKKKALTARQKTARINADLAPLIEDWIADGVIPVKSADRAKVAALVPLVSLAIQTTLALRA